MNENETVTEAVVAVESTPVTTVESVPVVAVETDDSPDNLCELDGDFSDALRVEAECEDFEAECAAYNAEDEKTQAILIGISEVLNTYGQNLSRCLEAVERVSQSEFYTGIKVPFS